MQLMMPAESAHDTVEALGEVGLLQFKDLNKDKSAFQRTFANQALLRMHWLSLYLYLLYYMRNTPSSDCQGALFIA